MSTKSETNRAGKKAAKAAKAAKSAASTTDTEKQPATDAAAKPATAAATEKPAEATTIVGKEELVHMIAARAQVPLKEADTLVDTFTTVVREQIEQGHQVRLIGFGSWKLSNVSARTFKSIQGGELVHLPARKRVSFSAGSLLAQAAKTPSPAKKSSPSKSGTKKSFQ